MDLLKLLKKHPKDMQALYDCGLNITAERDKKQDTWSAKTWTMTEKDSAPLIWSNVGGYESPRRAVLHAIREGVQRRMEAVVIFQQQEVANVQA